MNEGTVGNGERPPLKGQTVASQRRDKEEGRNGKRRGEESGYDLGQKGRRVRMDGRMERRYYMASTRGRGEASFYSGRHLPTDRHYRAK